MIFADSSFLVSLYLPNDRFSASARAISISFRDAIAYPLLVELEFTNTDSNSCPKLFGNRW